MKSYLRVVAAAVLLAAGTSAVRAQGEFPLTYVLAGENDPLTASGGSYTASIPGEPQQVRTLPRGLSDSHRHFSVSVGGKPFVALLDDTSPPKLYVASARVTDLSAVQPLVGKGSGTQCCFGPINMLVGEGGTAAKVKVVLVGISGNKYLSVRPAGYMAGDAKLDGQTYRVAILDKNLDGRHDCSQADESKGLPWWMTDVIAVDADQDGKFTGGMGTGEIMPLAKAINVKDKYYRVEVAPDGSSVTFEKYAPKMGMLDVGHAASLMLMSDTGTHNLVGAGKWKVPEGRYRCQNLSITKADAKGKVWTLTGADVGPLKKFEVGGGETAEIPIGPPLALKVEAQPQGSVIMLNCVFVGKAGETYSAGLSSGSVRPPPPKVKVLSASGQLLAEGNLEYG